jgi:hypothetical protein
MPTSTSTTRACPHEQAKSSSQPRHCCEPCLLLRHPRRGTCTARQRRSSSNNDVQQAESSVSRIRQQGSAWDDRGAQGPEASIQAGGVAGQPANQGRTPVRGRILDTRGQAQDGDTRNVINARQTGTQRHGQRQATTYGGVGAMTTVRTAHRRWSPRGPVCSAERSARQVSPNASASPR